MKHFSQAVALLATIVLFSGCGDDGTNGKQPAGTAKPDTLNYEVLATVEYTGHGRYSQQSSAVMTVDKRSSESGEVGYVYSMVTDTTGDGGKTVGEVTLPAATIIRDPATERIVGGMRLLKNLGIVANEALEQISKKLPLDGTTLTRKFTFDVPKEFPGDISYQLKARRQKLESGRNIVAVLAVSSPFEYGIPESSTRVKGRHRVLCLLSADMNDVLYLCNNFTVTAPEKDRVGELRIEGLMYQLQDAKPISLAGLDTEFTRYFERLDLAGTVDDATSDTGLPRWAVHSLAVRDSVDIVAGAAIEGRPNFAVCATVGLALLLDSAASTTTALLHEADVIDWEYKGVTNYAGQGYGLMFAQGFEKVSGRDVDQQKWMDIGGVTGDLAALLIPQQVLGSGVKVGTGGVKIIKGSTLAGKSLRVGKHGLDLVRTGKGWQSSERIVNNLLDAKEVVDAIRWGIEAERISDKYATVSGQPKVGKPPASPTEITNSIGMKLKLIPAGEFLMGSADSNGDARDSEKPQHRVRITKPFYLGATEVTQGQWVSVMGTRPWMGPHGPRWNVKDDPQNPVSWVSWSDAQELCRRLSAIEGAEYRLATEAEWEYSCRAGTTTLYSCGDDESRLGEHAWFGLSRAAVAERHPHRVGQKKPNGFGLYDMHGNVWEWCQDRYDERYYDRSPTDDPQGPSSGKYWVKRGGGWGDNAMLCRSAERRWSDVCNQYMGFRVARSSSGQEDRPSDQSPTTAMSYLPKDAFAVMVFRVQAATRWLDRENVKIPVAAVELVKSQLGVNIRNVRELVIPLASDNAEPMAALVRFDNPYDKNKLAEADFLKDDHTSKEHKGVRYFREAGGNVCLCPVDERTLIFGPEPGMKKMLDASGSTSPLAKSVAEMGPDHVVLVAAQLAGTPAAVGRMLDDAPPDIARLLEGNKVGLVKAWLSLEPEAQVVANVTTADAESASILKDFVEQGLGQVGRMLKADASQTLRMLPPGFEPEDVDFLRRLHGSVEVGRTKSQLDVTIKIPSGFQRMVRKTLGAVEGAKASAEVSLARAQIRMFEQCLMFYRLHLGAYPTTEQGLEALIEVPDNEANDRWRGPYLDAEAIPLDPWGNPYQYELIDAGTFRLRSLGLDGIRRTKDDVTNHEDAEIRPRKTNDRKDPTDTSREDTNSIGMKFKQIPAGRFLMGERSYDEWGEVVDHPHEVTLTRGFQIGVYEVTQEQYEKVMGENPSEFKGSQNPVERVNWEDAMEFCGKLSALPKEKSAGVVYRLPTEAEWEYACRAGTTTDYSFGDIASGLREYAWIGSNSNGTTHPVGLKKPNAWGLHDMHGNVTEWCQDWHGALSSRAATDPQGAESGSKRIGRGADWELDRPSFGRSGIRFFYSPSSRLNRLGFRVVRTVSGNADSRP